MLLSDVYLVVGKNMACAKLMFSKVTGSEEVKQNFPWNSDWRELNWKNIEGEN